MLGGWGVAIGGPDPFTRSVLGMMGLPILIAHHWSRWQLRYGKFPDSSLHSPTSLLAAFRLTRYGKFPDSLISLAAAASDWVR